MRFSDYLELRTRLRLSEGLRLKEYVDTVGKRTIGYGYNVSDRGVAVIEEYEGRPYDGTLSVLTAMRILDEDIARVERDVLTQWHWVERLAPVRQTVILDMVFNMGLTKFKTFKQTIRLMADDDQRAAVEMLNSQWAEQVKGRAVTLAAIWASCRYRV